MRPVVNEWFYRGAVFRSKDIRPGIVGFVYRITNLDSGRSYIGQKRFTKARTRKPLKGNTRKRRDRIESDWHSYFGSCKELQEDVAKYGKHKFRRDIIFLCYSKTEMNYIELREQILEEVVIYPDRFYNTFIGRRIPTHHLANAPDLKNRLRIKRRIR